MQGDIVTIGGTAISLTAIGAGIAWVYNAWFGRIDRREKQLDEREKHLQEYTDEQIDTLRAELAAMKGDLADLRDVANRQWAVIHMLVAKIDPTDPVLRAAEAFLGKRIFSVPADMGELVAKLDEEEEKP